MAEQTQKPSPTPTPPPSREPAPSDSSGGGGLPQRGTFRPSSFRKDGEDKKG